MAIVIDANVLFRYLLDDHPTLSAAAAEVFESRQIILLPAVIAECVYVLARIYKVPRAELAAAVGQVLDSPNLAGDSIPACRRAVRLYGSSNLDFVDCLLVGLHEVNGYEVITFDEQLKSHLR